MLIAKGCPRVAVATTLHQVGRTGNAVRCPGESGVSEVVQTKVGAVRHLTRLTPHPVEVAW